MNIEIPSHDERIACYYKDRIQEISDKLYMTIREGSLQTNYRGHAWVEARWTESDPPFMTDELWDWLEKTYKKAGWLLERAYGEEGGPKDGQLIGIDCFKITPAED